jgi:hypothetical protein
LATFVLTHLSVQLGYAHASMPAALVLADNRSCSHSFSKFFWEGSESLSAKAQVSLFPARFLTIDGSAVRGCGLAIKSSELDFAALALHAFHFTKAIFRGALD